MYHAQGVTRAARRCPAEVFSAMAAGLTNNAARACAAQPPACKAPCRDCARAQRGIGRPAAALPVVAPRRPSPAHVHHERPVSPFTRSLADSCVPALGLNEYCYSTSRASHAHWQLCLASATVAGNRSRDHSKVVCTFLRATAIRDSVRQRGGVGKLRRGAACGKAREVLHEPRELNDDAGGGLRPQQCR